MRVLSLDGGGVKGLFYMYVLSYLQQEEEQPPLSERFDLVVGCSIGAIVGGLLVTGQMDGKKTFQEMDDLVNGILFPHLFGTRQTGSPLLRPYYDGSSKTTMLRKVFKDMTLGELRTPVAVIATQFGTLEERMFTSWGDPGVLLAEVLDASSALPLYFPPVQVCGGFFWDGVLTKRKTIASTLRAMTMYWQNKAKSDRAVPADLRTVITSDRVSLCSIGNANRIKSFYELRTDRESVRSEIGLLAMFQLGTIQSFLSTSEQEVEDELLHHLIPGGRYLRVESRLETKAVDHVDQSLRDECGKQSQFWGPQLLVWAGTNPV
jgi:hypothetical protein